MIDDFAHNPDKIAATLRTLHAFPGRLLILFQPHGYGPLPRWATSLPHSFAAGWRPTTALYLPDPVYQGGTVEPRCAASDWLAAEVSRRERSADAYPGARRDRRRAGRGGPPGDRIVIMGARDDTLIDFARGAGRAAGPEMKTADPKARRRAALGNA